MPPVTILLFQKNTTKEIKSDSPAIVKVFQTNTTACLKSQDGGADLYYSDGQWWPHEPEEMRVYKIIRVADQAAYDQQLADAKLAAQRVESSSPAPLPRPTRGRERSPSSKRSDRSSSPSSKPERRQRAPPPASPTKGRSSFSLDKPLARPSKAVKSKRPPESESESDESEDTHASLEAIIDDKLGPVSILPEADELIISRTAFPPRSLTPCLQGGADSQFSESEYSVDSVFFHDSFASDGEASDPLLNAPGLTDEMKRKKADREARAAAREERLKARRKEQAEKQRQDLREQIHQVRRTTHDPTSVGRCTTVYTSSGTVDLTPITTLASDRSHIRRRKAMLQKLVASAASQLPSGTSSDLDVATTHEGKAYIQRVSAGRYSKKNLIDISPNALSVLSAPPSLSVPATPHDTWLGSDSGGASASGGAGAAKWGALPSIALPDSKSSSSSSRAAAASGTSAAAPFSLAATYGGMLSARYNAPSLQNPYSSETLLALFGRKALD